MGKKAAHYKNVTQDLMPVKGRYSLVMLSVAAVDLKFSDKPRCCYSQLLIYRGNGSNFWRFFFFFLSGSNLSSVKTCANALLGHYTSVHHR